MATRSSARKRKVKAKSDDEADVKRGKSGHGTPVKRTAAPRAAKAKQKNPDWLVTNEKSPLTNEDLHAQLSDPKTYEGFSFQDWDDLRSTLPDTVPVNPDGHSISMEFLKYDQDFRRGIREFQEDLSSGRLDPHWQAAAAEAMEERARGEFDDYKEKNFEEFWGQKQKLNHGALAGEATNLKLETLVENGVFKVGDELFYSRAIGRKEKKILIEKECRIVSIGNNMMTAAIPPGHSKYVRSITAPELLASITPTKCEKQRSTNDVHKTSAVTSGSPLPDDQSAGSPDKGISANIGLETGVPHTSPMPQSVVLAEARGSFNFPKGSLTARQRRDVHLGFDIEGATKDHSHTENSEASIEAHHDTSHLVISDQPTGPSSPLLDHSIDAINAEDDPSKHKTQESDEDVIFHEIKTLTQFGNKIVEIDGRRDTTNLKEVPAVNNWKLIRVKRDNQDLGTLFDMREHFYLYKLPNLGETPTTTPLRAR